MINFKKLFETVYEPRSGDEKNFKDKHVIAKHKYPVETESQFTSGAKKAKRKADYDEGDDASVYEAAEVHTKRADKEAVIVRAVDPKTGQSKARVVQRRAGEIKIGEETELEESIYASDYSTRGVKSQFGGYRAEVKHKTKGHTMYLGAHGYSTAEKAKGEADAYLNGYSETGGRGNEANASNQAREHAKMHAISGPYAKKQVKEDLDEKVVNPYAVGMAAAMKQTGDTPPLKKSTIVKGHEIAKSIKKEAMDPVGKADADIDNDGDVDKSDKYLHNRRKAISKALRKEDLDEAVEVRHDRYMRSHGKKARDSGQGSGQWMFTHKSMGDVDYNNDKEVHTARGSFSDAKKSAQKWAKEHGHHSVYVMEEVDQLDELSPNTLHQYIKKAVDNKGMHDRTVGRTSDKDSRRKSNNRLSGIVSASGRLADKANSHMYEDVDSGENTASLDNGSYTNYVKSNKTQKIKNNPEDVVKEEDEKSISSKSFSKYKNGNKGPESFKEETEELDELKKSTLASYTQKSAGSLAGSIATAAISGHKGQRVDSDVSRTIKNRMSGINKATNKLAKEEVEQIDELSKKTLGSYIKKASVNAVNKAKESEKHYAATEHEDDVDTHNYHVVKSSNAADKASNRLAGIRRATDRLTKEDLDEAFKVGSMKLHDGSSVTLTRESVDALNGLFHQLNAVNKAKMEERLMSSSKGFSEILSFAKEAI